MLGVCYYPEQWPAERWAIDARHMRQSGLELVRIGEFAWSRIEPHEGEYDWAWLDQAIAALADAGLRIILGTPTATPPAWLTQRYPAALRVGPDGRRWSHGGRRHCCVGSADYRAHSRRIVTALAERYGTHPAVWAWQIDNELGNHHTARCACPSCRSAFQRWAQARYETLDQLNAAWGTNFWSQSYSDWAQLPLPADPVGGGHSPSLQLAYRRFASDQHVAFVREQAAILRRHSPGRRLTTNIAPLDDELDWFAIAAEVDVIAWDNYPHGFEHPADVAFFHDLVRGLKRQPFWVMEQQPGNINWTPYNPPTPPGQVRLWTYQALAHGAEQILFFRWRAARHGQEQYHSGLLNHDATAAQGLREAQQVANELATQPPPERAPATTALLVSYADAWAVEIEPHHADFSYWRMARAIYRDFWRRGINVDIVARGQDVSGYRAIVPVAPILIDDAEADRWRGFVAGGGTLTLTIRSFVKDQENVWTDRPLPAGLEDLIGGTIRRHLVLPPGTTACFKTIGGEPVDVATWAEDLDGARPALHYVQHSVPGIADACCVAEPCAFGAGSARFVGVYPPAAPAGLFAGSEPVLGPETETIALTDGCLELTHDPAALAVRWARAPA